MMFCIAHAAASALEINPVQPGIVGFLAASSGIAAVFGLSTQLSGTIARLFGSLGRASLGVYVMHILVGSGTRIALTRLSPDVPVAVVLSIATLLAIGIPWMTVAWLEKRNATWLFRAPLSHWLALRKPG